MPKPKQFHITQSHRFFWQSGLSMVELLIAMALGLLLTLGVTQIYLSGNNTYRQTQGLAFSQESARFVSAILTPELRSAGSYGCLARMNRTLDQVVEDRTGGGLTVPAPPPLQGWEYDDTGPGDTITLAGTLTTPGAGNWSSGTAGTNLLPDLAGEVVTHSDVVIVNAATPLGVSVNAATPTGGNNISLSGPSGVPNLNLVIATRDDCSEGELFANSSAPGTSSLGINNPNTFNMDYDVGSEVYEFTTVAYYVGAGANGEPALFRRSMNPLDNRQELISGVETLQILYGIDGAGFGAADDYVTADQVVDWDMVRSVRFAVMTRSQDEVLDEANERSFNMLGSQVAQASGGDRRARLVSVGTTAFRGELQ